MTMTPVQASGDDDFRLAPVLTVLWAGGEAVDAAAIGEAAKLVQAAARAAADRWPDVYRGPGRARLICRDDDPPSPAVVEAAKRAGVEIDAHGGAAPACDAALLPSRDFARIPASLPALVAESGAAARLAIDSGFEPALEGAPRRRGDVAASPEAIAEALLSPPRRVADRRDLSEYQREDPSRRALRYEYALLLRLIGEPSETGSGTDDSWTRAAAANAAASVDRSEALDRLRREYERGDALALAYGRRWRSTLAARSFLLFAVNFASGFVGALFPVASPVTVPLQFAMTGLLYLDQHVARRRRWRIKWIDYRRAAEAARIARFCLLAGIAPPDAASASWVDWRLTRALRGAPAAGLAERDAAGFLPISARSRSIRRSPTIAPPIDAFVVSTRACAAPRRRSCWLRRRLARRWRQSRSPGFCRRRCRCWPRSAWRSAPGRGFRPRSTDCAISSTSCGRRRARRASAWRCAACAAPSTARRQTPRWRAAPPGAPPRSCSTTCPPGIGRWRSSEAQRVRRIA